MISKHLLEKEAFLEEESYKLENKLKVAIEKNYPKTLIKEIKEEIRKNDIAFDAVMSGIQAELERTFVWKYYRN